MMVLIKWIWSMSQVKHAWHWQGIVSNVHSPIFFPPFAAIQIIKPVTFPQYNTDLSNPNKLCIPHQPVAVEGCVHAPKEEPAWPQVFQTKFQKEICQQHQHPNGHKLQERVRTAKKSMNTSMGQEKSNDNHILYPSNRKSAIRQERKTKAFNVAYICCIFQHANILWIETTWPTMAVLILFCETATKARSRAVVPSLCSAHP